jgi:hypothetical protein
VSICHFQIHYYSYTISENGLNQIYFLLITYNVCACANSDAHSSLLYAIILGRKYSIRSGTNNYFYRKIGLGELTESNRPVCDDTLSGLGGSGFVKPKDKTKKKKKKKEEELDNSADVQDNNVLT